MTLKESLYAEIEWREEFHFTLDYTYDIEGWDNINKKWIVVESGRTVSQLLKDSKYLNNECSGLPDSINHSILILL